MNASGDPTRRYGKRTFGAVVKALVALIEKLENWKE